MNDTVKRIMVLADEYADERSISWSQEKVKAKRQALEAELLRLFTPLSQEAIVVGFCSQPHDAQFVSVFMPGVRWAEKQHGIGGG